MIHAHVTTWFIALILFLVSFYLLKNNKLKAQKITHMVLRLFYLLVLATGGHLLGAYSFIGPVLVKGLIGLIVIASMELVLVRGKKGKPLRNVFILFVTSMVLVFYYGYVVIG